ncbi:hypothetical protein B0H15DRAFT_952574 [Mycena belliarum]|uniref:Uncharacterized protein n=1 Tax=Mycena belliarum TaxID=1033014 RepID=A0AAD6U0S8_9AGAR|nr:hypothetical protein B0H15DRAFT_952574 [Mycena belliae]
MFSLQCARPSRCEPAPHAARAEAPANSRGVVHTRLAVASLDSDPRPVHASQSLRAPHLQRRQGLEHTRGQVGSAKAVHNAQTSAPALVRGVCGATWSRARTLICGFAGCAGGLGRRRPRLARCGDVENHEPRTHSTTRIRGCLCARGMWAMTTIVDASEPDVCEHRTLPLSPSASEPRTMCAHPHPALAYPAARRVPHDNDRRLDRLVPRHARAPRPLLPATRRRAHARRGAGAGSPPRRRAARTPPMAPRLPLVLVSKRGWRARLVRSGASAWVRRAESELRETQHLRRERMADGCTVRADPVHAAQAREALVVIRNGRPGVFSG